jgi:predicted transcriptional regulator of viral defense system
MSKSTYISANLNEDQIWFLQLLDDYEVLYFSLDDVEARIDQKVANLNEIVENLHHKDFLHRIERGKYTRPNFKDIKVLSTFISADGVVAYWSALHHHGLTDRFPNKIFIKTTFRKRNTKIFNTLVQYVTVADYKMIGITHSGFGDKRFPLTDIEMTIIDCFDQPRYGGALPDLIHAFYGAELEEEKLIKYLKLYNNKSIIQRLGYLAELFQKPNLKKFISFAKENTGKRYILFDPIGPNTGTHNKEWKLRLNIERKSLLQMASQLY